MVFVTPTPLPDRSFSSIPFPVCRVVLEYFRMVCGSRGLSSPSNNAANSAVDALASVMQQSNAALPNPSEPDEFSTIPTQLSPWLHEIMTTTSGYGAFISFQHGQLYVRFNERMASDVMGVGEAVQMAYEQCAPVGYALAW